MRDKHAWTGFRRSGAAVAVALLAVSALARVTPLQAQSGESSRAVDGRRVFASGSGIVLNFIKPDRTGDFEAVIGKVREALQKSEKPERRQEATGWKVFKAAEPGANGSVLYVFVIDPAVKGADYTVSTILTEAFPSDGQALYKRYSDAYASGQRYIINLTLVSVLGQ